MSELSEKMFEDFYKAVASLENEKEVCDFFSAVCTPKETLSIAQRFIVAKMLKSGAVYTEIVKKTGASTATISRVNRTMNDGNNAIGNAISRIKDK